MAWITPKIDWRPTDYFNASDYNRIVGNILHLKTLIDEIFPDFDIGEMETTKTYSSMFYADEMNTIEGNLELINLYTYGLNIGEKQTYRSNDVTPIFREFNRIENATLSLYNRINAQIEHNTAPIITITSEYGDWATSQYYNVEGNIQPNGNGIGSAYIYYTEYGEEKQKQLELGHDGDFALSVRLMPGTNKFVVRATDQDNNPSFFVFYKYSDVTAPTLTITSASGYVSSTNYALTGTAIDSDSGIQSVTVNNAEIALAQDGSFSSSYTLSHGVATTFTVVATDNAGNSKVVTRTVTYDTSAHYSDMSNVTRTGNWYTYSWTYDRNGGHGWRQLGNTFGTAGVRSQCTGTGQSVSIGVTVRVQIDVTRLPNWRDIKRIIAVGYTDIDHPTQNQTFNLDGTTTTLIFDNSVSGGTTQHSVGEYADFAATAGIKQLIYYYV